MGAAVVCHGCQSPGSAARPFPGVPVSSHGGADAWSAGRSSRLQLSCSHGGRDGSEPASAVAAASGVGAAEGCGAGDRIGSVGSGRSQPGTESPE